MATGTVFSAADLEQMARRGSDPVEVAGQLQLFRHPPPPARLHRPCTVHDGILSLPAEREQRLLDRWRQAARQGRLLAFVPASGAASRMFAGLQAALTPGREREPLDTSPIPPDAEVARLLSELPRFAFTGALADALARQGRDLETLRRRGDWRTIVTTLLDEPGLGLAQRPKGLIPFHRYPEGPRSAFVEHLVEATALVRDDHACCRVHCTIPAEARQAFEAAATAAALEIGGRLAASLDVHFSVQDPATDTIAVDLHHRPFRQEDGSLLFRPGGHGALLGNLQGTGGDLVLVKNIDNILPEDRQAAAVRWKGLLTGLLVELQEELHHWCRVWDRSPDDPAATAGALAFLAEHLRDHRAAALATADGPTQRAYLAHHLARPLRVCGVVPNQGEPGGGPFWVVGADGEISPQIVEVSQVDTGDPGQRAVLAAATHFNPVDLVCGLRDHHGNPFDLGRYVDRSTVFIARKSAGGRELQALERPGLWNGAMARWHTIFVEVPAAIFAPVKTVFDLLRPEHQPRT